MAYIDLSSKYRYTREYLSQRSSRGLETSTQPQRGDVWITSTPSPHNTNKYLFLEPNASDPLNKEAAEDLARSVERFRQNVRISMRGGSVRGESFDDVMI